jgi:hypothetical protein
MTTMDNDKDEIIDLTGWTLTAIKKPMHEFLESCKKEQGKQINGDKETLVE